MHRAKATSTSRFGVGRRESHDSSDFYARFPAPILSPDETIERPSQGNLDMIHASDARDMSDVDDASIALVVTSPPYFAGKSYEEVLGKGHVPATYIEYLALLEDVFRECVTKLEPGGRIAVNVANLGRKPYRSLSSDVVTILQDRLGLLLRGEIVWVKGKAARSSCAWGSFQSAANPVLRDVTERIIVASKGRFDRALSRRKRAMADRASIVSISKDEFMESTTDVWEMQPESATRVGHPAPFPVELPERLIHLYTYRGDVVLDPFIGSGTTAVAAVRTQRHFIGFETDDGYRGIAQRRIQEAKAPAAGASEDRAVAVPAMRAADVRDGEDIVSSSVRKGRQATEIAHDLLVRCGFVDIARDRQVAPGVEVAFTARDNQGRAWLFDVAGGFTSSRGGLRRTDVLWKALGKAAVIHSARPALGRLVLLTTDLPAPGSPGEAALEAARGEVLEDVIEMLAPAGRGRLERLAAGDPL